MNYKHIEIEDLFSISNTQIPFAKKDSDIILKMFPVSKNFRFLKKLFGLIKTEATLESIYGRRIKIDGPLYINIQCKRDRFSFQLKYQIHAYDDEWFYVSKIFYNKKDEDVLTLYYKCDQFSGVLEFLESQKL